MKEKSSHKALGLIGILDIRNIKNIAKEIEEKAAQRTWGRICSMEKTSENGTENAQIVDKMGLL